MEFQHDVNILLDSLTFPIRFFKLDNFVFYWGYMAAEMIHQQTGVFENDVKIFRLIKIHESFWVHGNPKEMFFLSNVVSNSYLLESFL